jgi:hypothetical protein
VNPKFLTLVIAPSLALLILNVTIGSNAGIFAQTMSSAPTVKITHPTPDQQISTNNGTLRISGISSDNSTSNCEVSIIANNVKPYQRTVPNKDDDYSSWSFTLNSSYTPIKEGPNKLTSKISCLAIPANATKWYSVNFTGVFKDITTSDNQSQEVSNNTNMIANNTQMDIDANNTQMDIDANNTQMDIDANNTQMDIDANNTQMESLNKTTEKTSNVSSQSSVMIPPANLKNMSALVKLDKDPISRGSLQTVRLNISDLNTGQPLSNATVEATITGPSGKSIVFENMTAATGETSFSWKVARVSETGLVHIKFRLFAPGFEPIEMMTAFEVVKNLNPDNLDPFT